MSGGGQDVATLRAEVEEAREELAHTVDQLAARLDVTSRVQDAMTTDDGRPAPVVLVAAGVAAATLVAVVVLAVRRRRS